MRVKHCVAVVVAFLFAVPATLAGQGRYAEAVDIGVVDSVWSATLDEHRPYLVYTPPSYTDTTVTPQRYPVLYLLDGDAHFHSVSGLVQILGTGVNGTYAIPEMIVVAIPNTNRTRDLTPTHTTAGLNGEETPAFELSGGNGDFFAFLENELIPEIEAEYRTEPYRVFVGHSFGGITTLTFNANPLLRFDGYYILSDLIEIPNLRQRANAYVGYLMERYAFGRSDARPPEASKGEEAWLAGFSVAAFL